jgi:hypothetical protein
MKHLISRIALFASLALTGVFVQCSTNDEEAISPVALSSNDVNHITQSTSYSAENLAADTSFIELVRVNKKVVGILDHKLKTLGNKQAREQQSKKIAAIHNQKDITNADFLILVHELGFKNIKEFAELLSETYKRNEELKLKGIDLGSLNKEVYSKAYKAAADKLDFGVASYDVCVECPFNNCNECWGSGGLGGDDQLEQPGGGSGGTVNCQTACANIRNSAKANAEYELMAEWSIACPTFSIGVAKGMSCLGPLGAATGFVCTATICGSLAYARYLSNINIAENQYIVCLNGCK